MWIYGFVFAGFAILFWLSRKEKIKPGAAKGIRGWYQCAAHLHKRFQIIKSIERETLVLILIVLFAGSFLAMIVSLLEYKSEMTALTVLSRGTYQEESRQETLKVQDEEEKVYTVDIEIPSQIYTKRETDKMFEEALRNMEDLIRGENESLEYINQDMTLITQIPNTPIQVVWTSDRPDILNWEGKQGDDIPKEGVTVNLKADLTYREKTEIYEKKVKIFPAILSEEEKRKQTIQEEIVKKNKNREDDKFYLPAEIEGKKLKWFRPVVSNGLFIMGITVVAILLLVVGKKREKIQEKEKRKIQMMLDYPDILSKLILLLNAGMNMRKAFVKVALDYKKQNHRQGSKGDIRYAYEEILVSYYEMERGISEVEAYEHLGVRCELSAYKTFSVLLVQNLRKGSRGLLEMMEREAATAFEDRKRKARILGEQASTKLLIPMMAMLSIVFVILLVPAFLSF